MIVADITHFTNSIGLGTVFILGGLAAAYWAIRNSISGTQRNELDIANARSDRLLEENLELRTVITKLEAKTDLEHLITLLEAAQKVTHAKIDKVAAEVAGLRKDMAKNG